MDKIFHKEGSCLYESRDKACFVSTGSNGLSYLVVAESQPLAPAVPVIISYGHIETDENSDGCF